MTRKSKKAKREGARKSKDERERKRVKDRGEK